MLTIIIMNRTRSTSIANAVRENVLRGGPDRLWVYSDFKKIPKSDRMALAAALSRLVKSGELRRIRRGVYYRPAETLFGPSNPDPSALTDAVFRAAGGSALPSGIEAYNRLGLTTQMAGVIARSSTRRIGSPIIGGHRVHTTERPLDRQRGIKADERAALDALRDITRIPDSDPSVILERLMMIIRSRELNFVRLARYSRLEPPRVRALLGALGDRLILAGAGYLVPRKVLKELHESLNPLTTFSVRGAPRALGSEIAERWQIKAA